MSHPNLGVLREFRGDSKKLNAPRCPDKSSMPQKFLKFVYTDRDRTN